MIEVVNLKIGSHSVPAPPGLSELLENTWVTTKTERYDNDYERQVIKRNNQFITILKKKR